MYRFWLMAGSAGLASAAVFLGGIAAATGGAYIGFMMAYLAPAPLYMAGLGLGGAASIIAGIVGTVPVALVADLPTSLGYAVSSAAPAAILGRQAMLSRRTEDGAIEWYPPGALAGWLCGVGAVTFTLLCILLAVQPAGLSGTVKDMLVELTGRMPVREQDRELFVQLFHPFLPGGAVAVMLLIQVGNGALAQGLLSAMKRAIRPSPDIGALILPGWTATVGAGAALAAIVLGGDWGYFARNLVIVTAVPFFLQGLSVVHVLARKASSGAILLAVFYVTLVILGWAVAAAVVVIGLVEQVVGLRRRLENKDQA